VAGGSRRVNLNLNAFKNEGPLLGGPAAHSLGRGTLITSDLPVSCGIPGHDHPGDELRTNLINVNDGALRSAASARCGFATDFDYRADT